MAIQDVPITSEGVYAHLRLLESVLHNASDVILVTEAEPIDLPPDVIPVIMRVLPVVTRTPKCVQPRC